MDHKPESTLIPCDDTEAEAVQESLTVPPVAVEAMPPVAVEAIQESLPVAVPPVAVPVTTTTAVVRQVAPPESVVQFSLFLRGIMDKTTTNVSFVDGLAASVIYGNSPGFEESVGQSLLEPALYDRVYEMLDLEAKGKHSEADSIRCNILANLVASSDVSFPTNTIRDQRWTVDGNGFILYHSSSRHARFSVLILPRKGEVLSLVRSLCLYNGGNPGLPTVDDARALVKAHLKIPLASLGLLFALPKPSSPPRAPAPRRDSMVNTATKNQGPGNITAGDGTHFNFTYQYLQPAQPQPAQSQPAQSQPAPLSVAPPPNETDETKDEEPKVVVEGDNESTTMVPQEGFYHGESGGFHGPTLIWKFVDGGYVRVGGGKGYTKVSPNLMSHYVSNGKTYFSLPISVDMNPEVVDSPTESKQHKFYVHLEGPSLDGSGNVLTNEDGSTILAVYKVQAKKAVADSLCEALKAIITMDENDPDLVDVLDGDDPDLVDTVPVPPRSPTTLESALSGTVASVLNMSQDQRNHVKAFSGLLNLQVLDNLKKMVAKTRAVDGNERIVKNNAVSLVADHLASNGGITNNVAMEVMKPFFRVDPIKSYFRRKQIALKGKTKAILMEQAFDHFLEEAKKQSM